MKPTAPRIAGILLLAAALTGCTAVSPHAAETPAGKALTAGWIQKPFKYEIQHPYDLDVNQRYHYDPATDTHDFVVFGTDKPHAPPPNHTNARTEMRFLDNYTTGQHMFEADVLVKPGTHASIMQVFGAAKRATTFMFDAQPDGTLTYYDTVDSYSFPFAKNMNDVWFNLKVIHDPAARDGQGEVKVYIDNNLVGTVAGHGPKDHYFKCGPYSRDNAGRCEVLFRNIKYWVRPGQEGTSPPAAH